MPKEASERNESIGRIFREAIDNAEAPIALIDEGRNVLFCNRAWKSFHGIDEETDLFGRNVSELRNEVIGPVMDRGREAWKVGNTFHAQFYADWTGQWVQLSANRLRWLSSEVIVVIIIDITDTVRSHEKRLKAHFRAVPAPTFIWKKEGDDIVLKDFNDAAIEVTEGKAEQALGVSARDLYRDKPGILSDLERCMEEKAPIQSETEYRSLYSDWTRWFNVRYAYVEPDTVMVHTEDITDRVTSMKELEKYRVRLEALVEQRTAELRSTNERLTAEIEERKRTGQALATSEERYRAISEITSDYTYSGRVYPDTAIRYDWVAGAFTKITGYPPDEADAVFRALEIVHPVDRCKAERQIRTFLSGSRSAAEFRIVTREGEVKWILSHGLPGERTGDGGVQVVGAVKDITDRKVAELGLENRNRELRSLNTIGDIFDSCHDGDSALIKVLDLLLGEARIETGGVWIAGRSGKIRCLASRKIPEELLSPLKTMDPGDRYVRAVAGSDRACIIEDIFEEDDHARAELKKGTGVARVVALPVKVSGELRATYIFGFPPGAEISTAKLDFMNVVGRRIGLELEKQDLILERESQEEKLKRLAMQLLESAENERAAVAHELHDVIGQEIISIRNYMPMLKRALGPAAVGVKDLLKAMSRDLEGLTAKTRDFSYSLHPPVLGDIGLSSAIEEYIAKIVKPSGLKVELIITGFDEKLPELLARNLYMIAQEALTNVMRHSSARYVVVKMIKGYPDVIMDIRDDGKGFEHSRGGISEGLGITGMRERVQNLNGRFKIQSAPGEGTHVRVEIPLEVEDEQ